MIFEYHFKTVTNRFFGKSNQYFLIEQELYMLRMFPKWLKISIFEMLNDTLKWILSKSVPNVHIHGGSETTFWETPPFVCLDSKPASKKTNPVTTCSIIFWRETTVIRRLRWKWRLSCRCIREACSRISNSKAQCVNCIALVSKIYPNARENVKMRWPVKSCRPFRHVRFRKWWLILSGTSGTPIKL